MADGNTDFDLDDLDGDENDGDSGAVNKNFADLRKYARKMEREAKAAQAKVEELSTFQAEVLAERKQADLDRVFGELGLSPKHAALFARVNPEAEVTADSVKAFAAEYELTTAEGGSVEAPEPEASGLTPIVTGSSGGTTGPAGKVSSKEWVAMQSTDLARAQKLFEQGMVDFSDASAAGSGLYHDNI